MSSCQSAGHRVAAPAAHGQRPGPPGPGCRNSRRQRRDGPQSALGSTVTVTSAGRSHLSARAVSASTAPEARRAKTVLWQPTRGREPPQWPSSQEIGPDPAHPLTIMAPMPRLTRPRPRAQPAGNSSTLLAVAAFSPCYARLVRPALPRPGTWEATLLVSEMTWSWYYASLLLHDSGTGHFAIHNFYLLLAFSRSPSPWAAWSHPRSRPSRCRGQRVALWPA
jgi:hypothetical protein